MKSGFLSQFAQGSNRMEGTIGGLFMVLSLDQVCTGVWACVVGIDTSQSLRQRLRDFGLVPGTKIRRKYAGPGGHVMAVELRGSVLALRSSDLRCIRVRL